MTMPLHDWNVEVGLNISVKNAILCMLKPDHHLLSHTYVYTSLVSTLSSCYSLSDSSQVEHSNLTE